MKQEDKDRLIIIEDRKGSYGKFWDECPIELLKSMIATKALRATYIRDYKKRREEYLDVMNYLYKVLEREANEPRCEGCGRILRGGHSGFCES